MRLNVFGARENNEFLAPNVIYCNAGAEPNRQPRIVIYVFLLYVLLRVIIKCSDIILLCRARVTRRAERIRSACSILSRRIFRAQCEPTTSNETLLSRENNIMSEKKK